jgi:hypothetical protein
LNYKHYALTILSLEQKFGLELGRAQKRALAMTDISVTSQKTDRLSTGQSFY